MSQMLPNTLQMPAGRAVTDLVSSGSDQPINNPTVPKVAPGREWRALEEAVVGLGHRQRNLPCQDAARTVVHPRAVAVLADGAGSSAVSELGAQAVVWGLARLIETLEKPLAEQLDRETFDHNTLRALALMLVKHGIGLLNDLATQHRRPLHDFRCTLQVFITGKQRHLWLRVGDGEIVVEQHTVTATDSGATTTECQLHTLGHSGKGEFANQTQFLDSVAPEDVQIGHLPADKVTGVALMSDGAAERLVSNDGHRVAGRVTTLLEQLRADKLRRATLTQMFYEEGFCQGTSGDDRSIALLACNFTEPAQEPDTPPEMQPTQEAATLPEAAASSTISLKPGVKRTRKRSRKRPAS